MHLICGYLSVPGLISSLEPGKIKFHDTEEKLKQTKKQTNKQNLRF